MASLLFSTTAPVTTFLLPPHVSNGTIPNPYPSLLLLRPTKLHALPSPIFLPHLEEDEESPKRKPKSPGRETKHEEEENPDPILHFFRSRAPQRNPDPAEEGRVTLRRNRRRPSWKLAGFDGGEDTDSEFDDDHPQEEEGSPEGGGVVEEVVRMARAMPENATLGEALGKYAARIGESECVELVRRFGEEKLVVCGLYLFEWMGLQTPSLVTPTACSAFFTVLGTAGMGEKLMVFFRNLPWDYARFVDVRVYNSAISGLSCCKRYKDAWKVYEAMEANNILPDHVTCSSLITIMRKSGRSAKEAWDFFERMNRKGVKMKLEVYGAIIKSFCDEDMKEEALIIQTEMERKGIPTNAIIYNTLMDAYVKSNQVAEAEGLFNEMKEKGLKPTAATYNILMDAYSKRMQPEIVENLLVEMGKYDLKANVRSYTSLISAYGRQRKMSDMAADAFLRMKKVGIRPTSHSYTALIHAYSVGGWHKKALTTFENMKREGISPSIETYTALLDAFRRNGDANTLMEIWRSMINDKIEGTRVTFNILLDGLCKQGMYVQARDVIHEFGRLGMQPTVMTFNMLMNGYARGGQHNRLPQLVKEMVALDLKPDSYTYSTIIYAYIRVRDFKMAFYYHKEMVRSGQVPDEKSYQKLRSFLDVKAASKNRKDRSAILGIVNSKMGLVKSRKGKKDEFWKNRKR